MEVKELIRTLALSPNPEGGFFRETYRAAQALPVGVLPEGYQSARSFSTCIYYLLTAQTFSALHRLPTDEIYHFYAGDPVQMLQLYPSGEGRIQLIGNSFANDESPQVVVPAGVWQGSRLVAGGTYALMGTTMAPGFDYADFEEGKRQALQAQYRQHAQLIAALTRV